ncbi:MAG TPA: Lrp/AsnC family transcriptional regulator [Actinocrinis sp.]|nr:Lrp/AsnC family transcriptional regulator [Actinocrinis sp.]
MAESDEDQGQVSGAGPTMHAQAGRTAVRLDDTDRVIIAEMLRDGRISVRTLAEKVHVSRANAYARMNRLMAEGVISGFSAQLDPERAGLGTSAYIMLSIEQNAWRSVSSALLEVPCIEHFALVGGDFDILVLVRATDNATLRRVVLERIQGIAGVRSTRTWLVFDEAAGMGNDWSA